VLQNAGRFLHKKVTFAGFVATGWFLVMIFFRFLLLLLWLTVPTTGIGQYAQFESLTIEQGLSQGMIFDILQTRDGFLWVATKDGLNRYDGYNFKVFSNHPFDPFSLGESTATTLFEDSRGLLWICTMSKGLDVYDRRTGRFHHIPLLQGRNMVESGDGSLWMFRGERELVRLTIPKDWEERLPGQADLGAQVSVTRIPIEESVETDEVFISLWLKEDGNMRLFSTARQYEVAVSQNFARSVASPGPGGITGGAYQNGGQLWISDDSIALYAVKNGQTFRYLSRDGFRTDPLFIQEDGNGGVWLLFGDKLWQLNTKKPIDLLKPDWTLDHNITCITTDRNGNIWVGTAGYGLRKINPRRQMFHTGAVGKSIWRLWRGPKGQYFWRDVSEIYRYDPVTAQSGTTTAFPEMGKERKMDLVFDSSGAFWLLGAAGKDNTKGFLFRYHADGKPEQRFPFQLNVYDYHCLKAARNGALWITGGHCQLVRFDPHTAHFEYFDYSILFGEKSKTVQAYALAEDGNGTWWIGTQQGLVKGTSSLNGLDFQLLQADPGNPKGLNNNSIACLLPDPARPGDVLWIGTKGGGIHRLDLHNGQVQHLTTADGLPDMVVYGILPGNENPASAPVSLWCSTNRGLARIVPHNTTPATYTITTFTAAKGLQDNEFNTQAFFKAANGELLFGGVNGLNRFFPEDVHSDTSRSPVFIVGIEVNHKKVTHNGSGGLLPAPLEYLREFHLSYDQNNLSFEFAVLDFTDPAQNRYRYRLVGLDADWVETGGHRFAHFTHLAPGRYELQVQGSNGEGVWQDIEHPVILVVSPPWYRSNLAYLLYLVLLFWAGWQAYRFQIQRVKEREQLVFEQRETERVKAMEQVKTNFFSNITHEFRTPLSLILEPARRILSQTMDPDIRTNARHIEHNSHRLMALVTQLLDMAKIESGSMTLDLRQGDFLEVLREVFRSFLPLAEQRGIRLKLRAPNDFSPFSFDANKVELVLNNLISNALKFTPEGGDVSIVCRNSVPADPLPERSSGIQVTVSDSGIGIPGDSLAKVFDRFYQVDGSHTRTGEGTGIGLALSKELAELMGGGITLQSEVGKGAAFTFWLPIIEDKEEEAVVHSDRHEREASGYSIPARRDPADQPSVLLIDDNAELRAFIKQCLAPAWQVVEASNAWEGIEKALQLIPDLVISDLMMPLKDGYAVCDELKNNELTAHIPVILLTAKSAMDAKIKGLRSGADDYLTKPFNTEELLARMENLVELRRRLRQRYGQLSAAALTPDATDEATFLTQPDRDFLRRFTLVVERHLPDGDLGVEKLAQKMSVSRVQLHRKLKALTDQNVSDFVRDYRLERAMAMLRNREGLVYEVASRAGFNSEKYFSRAFKEKFGISPSQVV